MAGKKDYAVAVVVTGMTNMQAAQFVAETMKTKSKVAPSSRGTAVKGRQETIGKLIQSKKPQLPQK